MPERATPMRWSEKSAEVVVAGDKAAEAGIDSEGPKEWKVSPLGYRDGKASDVHASEARHSVGAGEARKDVTVSETISPNSNSAKPGVWLVNQAHDLNHSNRPVRTRMPGGVGGECVTMTHPLSRWSLTAKSPVTYRLIHEQK